MAATVIEHKKAICVEFGDTNNNKVWQYTLFSDGTALTEWGRVGKSLQSKTTTHSQALSKWRQKTNQGNRPDKRYTEVKAVDTVEGRGDGRVVRNANLTNIARTQIKHTNPTVQELIDFLVSVNAHNITQATGGRITFDTSTAQFKTPLGVIDPSQVSQARSLLAQIADLVRNNDYDNYNFNPLLNQYLRLIPHDVGMTKISPSLIFPNFSYVQQENDLLDGLDASFAGVVTQSKKTTKKKTTKKKSKKDDTPKVFDVQLEIVTDKKIISMIREKYQETRKSQHQANSLSVKTVYKVDIATMAAAFRKYGAKLQDQRKLWHGTKASNLLSILRQGLVIPPESSSHCTGRMYGNGVYFSSVSTKALNYALNTWRHGGDTSRTFMFLALVAMGKCHITKDGWERYPVPGTDSTWAKAGRALYNDEMIVYRLDQANLLYLVEFCPRRDYY